MGVQITWDNSEKTVLRQTYTGIWDVEDFTPAIQKTFKLLSGLPHVVHIVVDLTESDKIPSNILSVARDLDRFTTDNRGIVVIVGATPFVDTILTVTKRIAPKASANIHYADSLQEARALINSVEMSIA